MELPAAEAITLADLVGYQDGAVISRTLIKRATGTITVFAFDKGEGLSEHTAAYDALVQVLEGEADIAIAGTTVRTLAGQVVLLPANRPHALKAATRFKMLLTMIRS
jgi:quercetin dioxygenase-like cupin family protein